MKILILTDIHANLTALKAVFNHALSYNIDKAVLLGDHIDYGMRPNEVIEEIKSLPYEIAANLWGNHELVNSGIGSEKLSCDRARRFSLYTSEVLTSESKEYLDSKMNKAGYKEIIIDGKSILAVHAGLGDVFWEGINYNNASAAYSKYDYVLSGHTHYPLYFEKYYDDPKSDKRGKKRTVFINPGSIGQPRNHNPGACYAVLDLSSGSVHFNHVNYDIHAEQELYVPEVDEFYKARLEKGI